jgi:hypothetical protein
MLTLRTVNKVHGVDRPQPIASWTDDLTIDEKEQIKPHLLKIQTLKNKGLNGFAILANFIKRRVQPLEDMVHYGFEYLGIEDPTRMLSEELSDEEVLTRV